MQYSKPYKHLEARLEEAAVPTQCVHCGTCRTWYQSQYWNPVCPSGEWGNFDPYFLSGKMQLALALLKGRISWSSDIARPFFECTLCGNCSEQCHVIETNGTRPFYNLAMPLLEAVRADAVSRGLGPEEHKRFADAIATQHNPYDEKHGKRTAWLKEAIGETKLSNKPDFVYFVGCTGSYRQKNIAISTVKAFKKLGLNFTVMDDEYCCGSPMIRTGQWDPVKDLAEHNIELVKGTGAETIVTSCPGCFKVWSHDYSKESYGDLLGIKHNFQILHSTQLLADLLKKGKLKFENTINNTITYHDPCHMGRNLGEKAVYEAPRELLKAIPGVKLVEMERNRAIAWCCGSGGGVKSAFPDFALWTGEERIKEAAHAGAKTLASTCPFCQRNLDESSKAMNAGMEVLDVMELVEKAL